LACFEKSSVPSTTTSNWLRCPGVMVAAAPVLEVISAARLAARVSYPLQVGQKKISTLTSSTLAGPLII
jgi:hypothetical protein